ncbi:hypothetical protein G9A89_012463 [Geosiphon pyriformis]|nr:hypothetical protein G9A89_012463 [Geosiphon pyriformis]
MPKDFKRVVTKCTLEKPLGTINFSMKNDDDDNVLDGLLSLSFSFSFKSIVQVLVKKSFALDIDLVVVVSKSSQEKLSYPWMSAADNSPSQNPKSDIVMEISLSKTTSGKTAAVLNSSASFHVLKLENILEGFSAFILSLFA